MKKTLPLRGGFLMKMEFISFSKIPYFLLKIFNNNAIDRVGISNSLILNTEFKSGSPALVPRHEPNRIMEYLQKIISTFIFP